MASNPVIKPPEFVVSFSRQELEVLEHALFRYMNWSRVLDDQMVVAKGVRARVSEYLVRPVQK